MNKNDSRLYRVRQTRLKIVKLGVARLAVRRMNLHIYAQIFSEDDTKVLASASAAEAEVRKELNGNGGNTATATLVGKRIVEKTRTTDIEAVAFGHSGFRYHGRVEALADTAREAGLRF